MSQIYFVELKNKIKQTAESFIASLGYELVDLKLFKAAGVLNLKFLVDKPTGGISINECAKLNGGLSGLLDKENILEENFLLEVSSPGLDRTLLTARDFLKVIGKSVSIFLKEPVNSKTEIEAVVRKVEDNFLFLNLGDRIEKIDLNNIKKARQVT